MHTKVLILYPSRPYFTSHSASELPPIQRNEFLLPLHSPKHQVHNGVCDDIH